MLLKCKHKCIRKRYFSDCCETRTTATTTISSDFIIRKIFGNDVFEFVSVSVIKQKFERYFFCIFPESKFRQGLFVWFTNYEILLLVFLRAVVMKNIYVIRRRFKPQSAMLAQSGFWYFTRFPTPKRSWYISK